MKFPCDDTDDDGGISVDLEIKNKRRNCYLNEFHNRHIFLETNMHNNDKLASSKRHSNKIFTVFTFFSSHFFF